MAPFPVLGEDGGPVVGRKGRNVPLEFSRVKLEIYVPEESLGCLREALNDLGACHIGKYDCCSSVIAVKGTWRPLPGAGPYDGTVGELCQGAECKMEVVCPWELAAKALETIRRLHPYEEPVIHVLPLLDV